MNKFLVTEKNKKIEPALLPPRTSSARKNFALNVISNVAFQGVHTVVALWMTPFLISYLGIAAFGMIPLANTVTAYMGVFTTSLNLAISRFMAIELGAGDDVSANKTFNTAFFTLLGIIITLIPVAIIISIFFSSLFQIPLGWERDASWLFALVVAAFFLSVITGMFGLSPFIHSRFLLSNTVNILGLIARIVLVLILFSAFKAHLWFAGAGIMVSGLVAIVGYIILWRKLTPQLHIQISDFDRSRLSSLTGMGGWTLVNQLGGMLLDRVDLIVVNAFFGAAITGGYGAVVQISILVDTLVTTISTVIRPMILLKYSQKDFLGLRDIAFRSVKLFGLALALPVGLMCGLARPLLSIWLGPSFAYLSILLVIVVGHMSLNLSIRPLNYIHNAYNRVKWPAIVLLFCGAASAGADFLVALYGKWGYLGIAASTAVIWTVKNAFYVPIYTSHIMKQRWWTYIPCQRYSIIGTLFVGLTAYGSTLIYMPNNWLSLAISGVLISIVYSGIVWILGLDSTDKHLLMELLPLKSLTSVRDLMKR